MVPKYFPMKAMVELVWVLAMNNIVYVGKRRASMIANSLACMVNGSKSCF